MYQQNTLPMGYRLPPDLIAGSVRTSPDGFVSLGSYQASQRNVGFDTSSREPHLVRVKRVAEHVAGDVKKRRTSEYCNVAEESASNQKSVEVEAAQGTNLYANGMADVLVCGRCRYVADMTKLLLAVELFSKAVSPKEASSRTAQDKRAFQCGLEYY
ncbi:hypothetical protein Tcan_08795 [Toxocara canis]|uniref:Uncharacterized protein n=1 Tax=Toxocara canis TaxID=6265 RepID=A0A0B2V136_TOXCA|nr:hypothetical protein Tcan_08795 [Toxocara canis]